MPQEVRVGGEVPLHRGEEPRLHEAGQPSNPDVAEAAAVAVVVGGLVDVVAAAVPVRVLGLTFAVGGHSALNLLNTGRWNTKVLSIQTGLLLSKSTYRLHCNIGTNM